MLKNYFVNLIDKSLMIFRINETTVGCIILEGWYKSKRDCSIIYTYLLLMLTEWSRVDQSFWQFSIQTRSIFQTRFPGFVKPICFFTTQVISFGDQGNIKYCNPKLIQMIEGSSCSKVPTCFRLVNHSCIWNITPNGMKKKSFPILC